MNDNNRLTDSEREILDKLVDIHHLYLELPKEHPMHLSEWVHSLHHLQRLIMSRPTARVEGWIHNLED